MAATEEHPLSSPSSVETEPPRNACAKCSSRHLAVDSINDYPPSETALVEGVGEAAE
jgi:hypothetical protein